MKRISTFLVLAIAVSLSAGIDMSIAKSRGQKRPASEQPAVEKSIEEVEPATPAETGAAETVIEAGGPSESVKTGSPAKEVSATKDNPSANKALPKGKPDVVSAEDSGYDKEGVRRIVRFHLPEIRTCYNEALSKLPKKKKMEGKLVVAFSFGAGGVVTKASVVSSELKNAKVEKCIINRIKTWVFPEPPKGVPVEVKYPFFLKVDTSKQSPKSKRTPKSIYL